MANTLCGEDHIIKGASVYVSNAAPKQERNFGAPMNNNFGGGRSNSGPTNRFDNRNSGGSGGPFNNGPGMYCTHGEKTRKNAGGMTVEDAFE